MLSLVKLIEIDPGNKGTVMTLSRSGNQNLLGAGLNMLYGIILLGIKPG